MKWNRPDDTQWRSAILCALLTALASQIHISLFTSDFKISVAIILIPMFSFLVPGLPVFLAALLAAPGVFLLRGIGAWLVSPVLPGIWEAYAPEMLFYSSYGLLLALYLSRVPLHPFRAFHLFPLVAIDALANFLELSVRLGIDVFNFEILLRLLVVGVGRTLLAGIAIRALDFYGFQVLHREDAERYRRLLLLTSTLKSEIAWMNKGTSLIENTMNCAYRLYSQLRQEHTGSKLTEAALAIAKDIHEVKKEYFLIMRGISDALDTDMLHTGMHFKELLEIMRASVQHTASATGKQVAFSCDCCGNFYTSQHHTLMSIFHNLLNNAVEAAAPGTPARVSVVQRDAGDAWVFEVRDDCGGIKPDLLGQIFVAGFSSKINYQTGAINRGLGLNLVKDLVEGQLQGELTVASEGASTVFTIKAPKKGLEERQDAVLSG